MAIMKLLDFIIVVLVKNLVDIPTDFLDIKIPRMSIPKSGSWTRMPERPRLRSFSFRFRTAVCPINMFSQNGTRKIHLTPILTTWFLNQFTYSWYKGIRLYEMILSGSGSAHFRIYFLGFYSFVDRLLYELL